MRWLLFLVTLPWTLTVGYGWVLLAILVGAAKAPKFDYGYGILTAEWRAWAAKYWGFTTTVGRGIICQPEVRDDVHGPSNPTEYHEDIHVYQVEDAMALSLIVGLIVGGVTGDWILAGVLWWSGGMWQIPNFLTAVLRYGPKYYYWGAEHERSAYAQTDLDEHDKSWVDYQREKKLLPKSTPPPKLI
jgi:hypothetical protein